MAKKEKNEKFQITNDTIFERNEKEFLKTEVDGEAVMMNTLNGFYWGLNASSTDIWNFLEKPATFKYLIDKLMEKYEVEISVCRTETVKALIQMMNRRIMKIKE